MAFQENPIPGLTIQLPSTPLSEEQCTQLKTEHDGRFPVGLRYSIAGIIRQEGLALQSPRLPRFDRQVLGGYIEVAENIGGLWAERSRQTSLAIDPTGRDLLLQELKRKQRLYGLGDPANRGLAYGVHRHQQLYRQAVQEGAHPDQADPYPLYSHPLILRVIRAIQSHRNPEYYYE